MAGFDYNALGKVAKNLITFFGRKVPIDMLRSIDGAPADADKPWRVGAPTLLHFKLTAVVVPYPQPDTQPTTDQDLVVILAGDTIATASQEDPTKTIQKYTSTDRMLIDGDEYAILGNAMLKPDANPLMHKLRVRKWRPDTMQQLTPFSQR